MLGPSATRMQQLPLIWLSKQREGIPFWSYTVKLESWQEKKKQNCEILLKLLRSVYFLVKNRIPHSTIHSNVIELQIANGDILLGQHIKKNPSNTQYTSKLFDKHIFLAKGQTMS